MLITAKGRASTLAQNSIYPSLTVASHYPKMLGISSRTVGTWSKTWENLGGHWICWECCSLSVAKINLVREVWDALSIALCDVSVTHTYCSTVAVTQAIFYSTWWFTINPTGPWGTNFWICVHGNWICKYHHNYMLISYNSPVPCRMALAVALYLGRQCQHTPFPV